MIQLNGKKMTKKAWKIVKSDIFAAMALTSVLTNLFFISGLTVFRATSDIDLSLYQTADERLCNDNYAENLVHEMEQSTDPALTKTKMEIICRQGDFVRYYDNAVQAYLNDTN